MKAAFEPHLIKNFRTLHDWVVVQDMVFDERITSSGIVLLNDNGKGTGIRPRWARVYAVGPEQQHVTPGQWICVAHGRWTRGVEVQDEQGETTLRKIDPNDILMVSDEQPDDDTMSDAVHIPQKTF
jgi:co-chaperonin GroES (HSP10)